MCAARDWSGIDDSGRRAETFRACHLIASTESSLGPVLSITQQMKFHASQHAQGAHCRRSKFISSVVKLRRTRFAISCSGVSTLKSEPNRNREIPILLIWCAKAFAGCGALLRSRHVRQVE